MAVTVKTPEITLEGKAKAFVDLLRFSSFDGLLEDIGFNVKKGIVFVVSSDDPEGGKFMHIGKYTGFKTTGEGAVGIIARENLKYISKLFKSDDDVKMEVYPGKIRVVGPRKEVTTPRLSVEDLNTYLERPPCPMDDDFIVHYKGDAPPDTVVKMNANVLADIVSDADLVEQNYFPLLFKKNGVLEYSVGSNDEVRTNHVISSSIEGLEIEGKELRVTLQAGLPELSKFLSGDILLSGNTDHPIWVKSEKEDAIIGFLLSPRVEDEEEEKEEEEEPKEEEVEEGE